ncbi:MAG: NnrU family protein [Arenibacterium sp.]
MILLIAGMLLWVAAHVFKRVAPEARARMGDAGKGLVAALIAVSVVLIVLGYRWSDFIPVWNPPLFLIHVNNLLMLLGLWVFGSSEIKGGGKVWPATKIRHPQLTAVKIWALAHLLVNGDLSSVILFGGMLAWAVLEVVLINKAEPDWTPPETAPKQKLIVLSVITLVMFAIIAGVHFWLGVSPLPA